MSKRRTQATIPEPYTDVVSLRTSVMAIKELVEDLAGQRGDQDTTAVTWDDLGDALGTGIGSKVSKSGDTMTGSLSIAGSLTASTLTALSGTVYSNRPNSGANVHVWFQGPAGEDQGVIYVDTSMNMNFRTQAQNGAALMNNGVWRACLGMQCRAGGNGGYGGNWFNSFYNGNGTTTLWIDNTNFGTFTTSSDYRIKKDVTGLPSMWEIVKQLRPISYTHKEFNLQEPEPKEDGSPGEPLVRDDDIPRWGFIAHELQETTILDAATGHKDAPDLIQSPNPWTVIAALTKALQEAMTRIEALEANG